MADPASAETVVAVAAPEPVVQPTVSAPSAASPSAIPAPAPDTPVFVLPAPARKRSARSERLVRRRIQAARLRARWRKASPFFAAQLLVLALAVVMAEWLEQRGGQPLLCRFIAALTTSLLTMPLWLVYLRRQRMQPR